MCHNLGVLYKLNFNDEIECVHYLVIPCFVYFYIDNNAIICECVILPKTIKCIVMPLICNLYTQ